MGDYESIPCDDGSFTLRHRPSGESMHSAIGPWEEACSIYVDQSDLPSRLASQPEKTLRVYDVGMGLATNALALLERYEAMGAPRPLHIVSFENDLAPLRFALAEVSRFPFLKVHERKLRAILEDGFWHSPDRQIRWECRVEDFSRSPVESESAELVYFDFYAPRSCKPLWTSEVFGKLRGTSEADVTLITYSVAKSVRTALLLAGFHVGDGISTERKRSTTIAASRLERLSMPLQREWFENLSRSQDPLPLDWINRRGEAFEKLATATQFQI